MFLPQQPLSAPLWIQTRKLYQDFIFSPLGVTLLQDLFRDKSTPFSTYLCNPGCFHAESGHLQSCAGLCPQAAWQLCPNLAELCLRFRRHPVSTTAGKPSLEGGLQDLRPPLCTPSPCPTPASVSCQDHEELREGTRKRQGLSVAWFFCHHWSHCSGLLVTLCSHYRPLWYHLTSPFNSFKDLYLFLLFSDSSATYLVHRSNICPAAGSSWPEHTWRRTRLLAEPTLSSWSCSICFPSTTIPGVKSLHTFVQLTLSHQDLGNYCLFLTPSSAPLWLKVASCSDGRILEKLHAISRTLVAAGFIARLGHPKDLDFNSTEAHKLIYCCIT